MTHNGYAPGSRTRALAASFAHGGSPSHIPLLRHGKPAQGDPPPPAKPTSRFYCDEEISPRLHSSTASLKLRSQLSEEPQPQGDGRWKARYDEAERKRKSLLTQSQKAERENAELQKRYQELARDFNSIKKQLSDKEEKLNHLRKVSEAVYREYDLLKNKYEVDQRVMQDAMNSASQWYKQNRQLKRKSAALTQKFLQANAGNLADSVDGMDDGDSDSKDGDELESLRNTIKEMSQEVARLQADLNAARLQEFEAQEQTVNLSTELEEERRARHVAELELHELRTMKENMSRVSRLVALEMTSLREQCQQEKEVALRMKSEADKAQKERNVLAHQSVVLMSDVAGDDKLMCVLQEMEDLRRTLEEERQKYKAELLELQEKLEEKEQEAQLELLEEKLKLAESELQCALQRAERAECHGSLLSSKISQLESEVQTLKCPPPPPPPPLPPPPPPPLPGLLSPSSNSSSSSAVGSCDDGSVNPVLEMANILGIPRKTSTTLVATAPGGAIDDIINQIKGGKFTLKRPEKQKEKKEEETPAAVKEMLSIIGTLKRRPKARQPLPADVAL